MCQSLLVKGTRALNDFTEGVENLTRNTDGFQEIRFSSNIDDLLARVVPIEIHNRFLCKIIR